MSKLVSFASISSAKVDRVSGIIRGASVITEGEARTHGLFIDHVTIGQVKWFSDKFTGGVPAKVNHGSGFQQIVGTAREFRIDGQQLRADFHLLKSHPMFGQILDVAETMPESVGLSISFDCGQEKIDGKDFARCEGLTSIDFVDSPAANPSGLFSAVDSPGKNMAEKSFLEQVKDFVGFKTELEAPLTALRVELNAKSTELATKTTELTTALGKITELSTKITTLETAATAHATALSTLESSVETRASAKAAAIVAGQGVPARTNTPPADPKSGDPAAPVLTGFARVQAAIAKELKLQGK